MKTLLALVALSATVVAQEPSPRYEFLARLRRVEELWRTDSAEELREEAAKSISVAQARYAAGDLSGCSSALGAAAGALLGLDQPSWCDSFAVSPIRHICDGADRELLIHFGQRNIVAGTVTLSARLDNSSQVVLWRTIDAEHESGPWEPRVPLLDLPAGDHRLTVSLTRDVDFDSTDRQFVIAIIARRDERLAKLKASIEKLGDKAPALERETAKWTLALLERLARGSTEAHEYPAAQMLDEIEKVVAAAAKGEHWYSMQDAGEHWLVLPLDGANVLTRVLVPDGLTKDNGAPLVLAFHGAAFDEDVWFDGYGAGAGPKLAKERGWLFAAVHSDAEETPQRVEAIAAALANIYPVEAKHVFLLGHSRGARTALRAQVAKPDLYCGVAAIGNALDDGAAKPLANHPLFLAAGDHDPAREAVSAMNKALTDAGSKSTKLTIYPNVEHWLCVQAALPDAFAWFDELAE
jgi:dienelactone hydrolase